MVAKTCFSSWTSWIGFLIGWPFSRRTIWSAPIRLIRSGNANCQFEFQFWKSASDGDRADIPWFLLRGWLIGHEKNMWNRDNIRHPFRSDGFRKCFRCARVHSLYSHFLSGVLATEGNQISAKEQARSLLDAMAAQLLMIWVNIKHSCGKSAELDL